MPLGKEHRDETNPYLYYSDGGFGTKEGKLWYVSTIHNEEMKKTVLSLQNSFSLILEDIPEVEA